MLDRYVPKRESGFRHLMAGLAPPPSGSGRNAGGRVQMQVKYSREHRQMEFHALILLTRVMRLRKYLAW
jgi:hypothetical protein